MGRQGRGCAAHLHMGCTCIRARVVPSSSLTLSSAHRHPQTPPPHTAWTSNQKERWSPPASRSQQCNSTVIIVPKTSSKARAIGPGATEPATEQSGHTEPPGHRATDRNRPTAAEPPSSTHSARIIDATTTHNIHEAAVCRPDGARHPTGSSTKATGLGEEKEATLRVHERRSSGLAQRMPPEDAPCRYIRPSRRIRRAARDGAFEVREEV